MKDRALNSVFVWLQHRIAHATFLALAALFLCLVYPEQAQGQVAFDAASSADTGAATPTTLTLSHTVTAIGSNRILIVGVSLNSDNNQAVSRVTYAGVNLTRVGFWQVDEPRVEIWRLVAPATGNNNIVVTLSSAGSFVVGAASFTNVNQTTPLGTFFSASGTSATPSVNVTGVNSGEIVIDTYAVKDNTSSATAGAGQTQHWNRQATSATIVRGGGSTKPSPAGGGAVAMSWNLSASRSWSIGAVALKPAALLPDVVLNKSVGPAGTQPPGTDLTYTVNFSNTGSASAQSLVLTDPMPTNTDFKVGSVTNNLGTTGLAATVTYSKDGGATYSYTPASGGGGAPAGYDRSVTHVRWTFTGNLSQTAPNNTGSVSFVTRIR